MATLLLIDLSRRAVRVKKEAGVNMCPPEHLKSFRCSRELLLVGPGLEQELEMFLGPPEMVQLKLQHQTRDLHIHRRVVRCLQNLCLIRVHQQLHQQLSLWDQESSPQGPIFHVATARGPWWGRMGRGGQNTNDRKET